MKKVKFFNTDKSVLTAEEVALNIAEERQRIGGKMETLIEKIAEKKFAVEKTAKDVYGDKTRRPHRSFWSNLFWVVALLIVAGLEYPINEGGFEVFGRSVNITIMMTAAFGLIAAMMSHFTGFAFKRGKTIMGVILIAAAATMFWFIAGFRIGYMKEMGITDNEGLGQFPQMMISLIIFMVGAIASYRHSLSEKEENLHRMCVELKKLETQKAKLAEEMDAFEKKAKADYQSAVTAKRAAVEGEQKDQEKEQKDNQADIVKRTKDFKENYGDFEGKYSKVTTIKDKEGLPYKQALAELNFIYGLISAEKGLSAETDVLVTAAEEKMKALNPVSAKPAEEQKA